MPTIHETNGAGRSRIDIDWAEDAPRSSSRPQAASQLLRKKRLWFAALLVLVVADLAVHRLGLVATTHHPAWTR